jgi:hypothetical protein
MLDPIGFHASQDNDSELKKKGMNMFIFSGVVLNEVFFSPAQRIWS